MTVEPRYSDLHHDGAEIFQDDPPHVRKFNWKTHGSKEYWRDVIEAFDKRYHAKVQIKAVADEDHPRQVMVVGADEDLYRDIMSLIGQYSVYFQSLDGELGTPAKVLLDSATQYLNDYDEKYMLVIGESTTAITSFTEAATSDTDFTRRIRTLADLLGWPECCIAAFEESHTHEPHDHVYRVAANTETATWSSEEEATITITDPSPLLNTLWRYLGVTFTYHRPCSFECDASIDRAEKHYEYARDIRAQEIVDGAVSWLSLPMRWSAYHNFTNLKNAYAIGSYTTNPHWLRKDIVWKGDHSPSPDDEPIHNTNDEELLDPDAPHNR